MTLVLELSSEEEARLEVASRSLGMFPGLGELTAVDFRVAEFYGDADDSLDWNS